MSIRLKLLLSYAAMLVVPLVLIVLISLLMVVVFRGDLQNLKSFYESSEQSFDQENFYHLSKEVNRTIERNPSLLMDASYLNDISLEIEKKKAGLVIRSNDRIIYSSSSLVGIKTLMTDLPKYQHNEYREQKPAKRMDNALYVLTQFDFSPNAKQAISMFIITKVNPGTYYVRKFFPILFISLLIILILTHVLLTYFMSKNIIKPLQLLRKAAQQIKEGHLDFEVQVRGKDEIGQLGIAFEEMRYQLKQSIRMKLQDEENRKELISNISHDLKTPITAIKGYIDGILDGVADTPEKSQKYMRTLSTKAEEMDHLIDELFLYSKLDMKRLPFSFETVDMLAFVTDWAEDQQFELEKQQVRFQANIRLDPDVKVSMDRDKFKRVLNNVIENSVKYMDKEDKQIHLTAYMDPMSIEMEISDNGQGIEPESLAHIFERFYRAEESRSSLTGGTGLGLAIAKQIMDGHGGEIAASSELERGTVIKLTLPLLPMRDN